MNIWTFFTGKSVVQTARLQDSSAVQHLKTAMQCTLHSAYFESRKTWLKFTISRESLNLFQVTNKINQFTRPDLAMIFSWLISNFPASNYCPKPTIKNYINDLNMFEIQRDIGEISWSPSSVYCKLSIQCLYPSTD